MEVLKCHLVIADLGKLSVSLDHRQLYAVGYKTKAKVLKNYALVLSDAERFPFLRAVCRKLYPPCDYRVIFFGSVVAGGRKLLREAQTLPRAVMFS